MYIYRSLQEFIGNFGLASTGVKRGRICPDGSVDFVEQRDRKYAHEDIAAEACSIG